jgi:hypothetical protein
MDKKLLFAGCSYTWGEGLQYHSGLTSIKFPEKHYFDQTAITNEEMQFITNNRFPKIVGDYFNKEVLVRGDNGGSNVWSCRFLESVNPNEISHVVFQLTDLYREDFEFEYNNIKLSLHLHDVLHNPNVDDFKTTNTYIDKKNEYDLFFEYYTNTFTSFNQFSDIFIEQSLSKIKEKLLKCEKSGIKTYILNWKDYYTNALLKDDFFSTKIIKLIYLGNVYNTIEQLINNQRPELTNQGVFQTLKLLQNDEHPSLLGHRIIADSVIKKIEGYEYPTIHTIQRRVI